MKIDLLLFEVSKTKGDLEEFGFVIEIFSQLAHVRKAGETQSDVCVHICGVFFTSFKELLHTSKTEKRVLR